MGGATTTYVLDTATPLTMLLAEQTGIDPAITYLHGLDLVAQHSYDGLGSVRQVVDAAGTPLLAQTYDPYGSVYASAGAGQSAFGFTNEYTDATGLLYLRARYYDPNQGRFFQLDTWPGRVAHPQSMNPYTYSLGNPILYTDPNGHDPWWCDDAPDPQLCYREYSENYIYNHTLDPLTKEQWEIIEHEAGRFEIPVEFLAATVATEIVYDTDWVNWVYDTSVGAAGSLADLAYTSRDRPLFDTRYSFLDIFHEYFGLAPILEDEGIGYGPAPGIANIHVGPATRIEEYFAANYPASDLLPDLGSHNQRAVRLRTLLSDEGNIRYAAAYLRRWADVRKDSRSSHLNDLTTTDMLVIYTVYRCALLECYDSVQDFQNTTIPAPAGEPQQLNHFLVYYRGKLRRSSK